MRTLSKLFLTGLLTLLPVGGTLYLVYAAAVGAERLLTGKIERLFNIELQLPGMGIALATIAILTVGLLMQVYIIRRLFRWGENRLYHVPLVRSLYGALRDFADYFSGSGKQGFQEVVALRQGDVEMIGFITRNELPESLAPTSAALVSVYIPWSFGIGGLTVLIARERLRHLEMSVEQAMKFVISAGVASKSQTSDRGEKGVPAVMPVEPKQE